VDEERGDASACPLIDVPKTGLGPQTSRRMDWKTREQGGQIPDVHKKQKKKEKTEMGSSQCSRFFFFNLYYFLEAWH
jgi:hypothetical protein